MRPIVMGVCMSAPEEAVPKTLWQDRQIRWDITKQLLNVRPGEEIVETFIDVEDTKVCYMSHSRNNIFCRVII